MNFLRALIAGLLDAVFNWGQKQAEKPKTIENADTPKDIADRNAAAYRKWLRDKKGDGH